MIKPVGFKILVKPDPIEEKTKSGIVLAVDEKLEKGARIRGTVIEVGPEAFTAYQKHLKDMGIVAAPWVQAGDTVYFARYAGKVIVDHETNEEFVVLNDEDICCRDG